LPRIVTVSLESFELVKATKINEVAKIQIAIILFDFIIVV
jgi:hypothetical protein